MLWSDLTLDPRLARRNLGLTCINPLYSYMNSFTDVGLVLETRYTHHQSYMGRELSCLQVCLSINRINHIIWSITLRLYGNPSHSQRHFLLGTLSYTCKWFPTGEDLYLVLVISKISYESYLRGSSSAHVFDNPKSLLNLDQWCSSRRSWSDQSSDPTQLQSVVSKGLVDDFPCHRLVRQSCDVPDWSPWTVETSCVGQGDDVRGG